MSYLGNVPNPGSFAKLDNIASGFNSSTKTFNLTVNGEAYTPSSVRQCNFVINNIPLEPGVAFTIGPLPSQVTFTVAPTTGHSFWGIVSSSGFDITNIPDDAVETVKILDSAVTTPKINNLAVTTGKIADLNVTTAKIDDGAVTVSKLQDSAVSTVKVANAAITAAKMNIFTSTEQTITTAGALTIAHGLSVKPSLWMFYLVCKTTEAGYSVNDEVAISPSQLSFVPDATNLNIRYASTSNAFSIPHKTTGVSTALTNGNWRLVVRVVG